MSRSTISTFQLFALFPDEESARIYLEARIWPDGPVCPMCLFGERISILEAVRPESTGYYRCLRCAFDFTVRTGTVMERSKIPLHKWLYSMYLLVTARKGISSMQLAKEIGITQKSAWFVLGRLREACGGDGPDGGLEKLRGTVEIAEQMLFRCVMVDAVQTALQDRPDAFDAVGVGATPDKFFAAVVDGFVRKEQTAKDPRMRRIRQSKSECRVRRAHRSRSGWSPSS